MAAFVPVTDADLTLARIDPAFRQKLLADNLDVLLATLKKLRKAPPTDKTSVGYIREGVELAVKLAELIQGDATRAS